MTTTKEKTMRWYQPLKAHWPPFAAVLVGGTLALASSMRAGAAPALSAPSAPQPGALSSPAPADAWHQAFDDDDDSSSTEAGTTVAGEVLEQIDVGRYSYLRLGGAGQAEVWAAVPKTSEKRGEPVVVANAQLMTNFASPTLARTFEAIYFGELGAPVHDSPQPSSCPGAADQRGVGDAPHPGAGSKADGVPVHAVAPAAGPNGRTVHDVHRAAAQLTGKTVEVRGVVVKSTPGVMGRTFVHLRDGSGSTGDGSNDLAVTTNAEPAVGAEVLFRGTVERDRDFGSGYRYDVLLSDAAIVEP